MWIMKERDKYLWATIIIPMLIVLLTNQWYPIPNDILSENFKGITSIILSLIGLFALYKLITVYGLTKDHSSIHQ